MLHIYAFESFVQGTPSVTAAMSSSFFFLPPLNAKSQI